MEIVRIIFALLGISSLGLGMLGIFIPVLPTTVFILLASWCFTRSSPRLDNWLRTHPRLGPPLVHWLEHRVIRMRAKVFATITILGTAIWSIFSLENLVGQLALAAFLFILLAYIWTRSSQLPEDE